MKRNVLAGDNKTEKNTKNLNGSAKSGKDLKATMKNVNKVIMKKDSRFKNMPSKLTAIGKKTAKSKLHTTMKKQDGKLVKLDILSQGKKGGLKNKNKSIAKAS